MNQEQLESFWATIRVLDSVGLLNHVMVIGSWVEYLYEDLFETGFSHSINTKDIDLLYHNIHKPKKKINLVKAFSDEGFIYAVDPIDGLSRIYKDNLIEVEFIAQVMGSGSQSIYNIDPIGLKAIGLREVNILTQFPMKIVKNGYSITIPEPTVYVIQKILSNPTRRPAGKKKKDIYSVESLLNQIEQSTYHKDRFKYIYSTLTLNQKSIFNQVCESNLISISSLYDS